MSEPRDPTCLRGNPKVCPEDECPSRFLCSMKAWQDHKGEEYDSVMREAIEAALREYGAVNV